MDGRPLPRLPSTALLSRKPMVTANTPKGHSDALSAAIFRDSVEPTTKSVASEVATLTVVAAASLAVKVEIDPTTAYWAEKGRTGEFR